MSHYSLIVALPPGSDIQEELDKRLAPYDENKSVEPYKDFEKAESPADFWWYQSIKRDAETVANQDHSKILPYDPDQLGISSASSRYTPEQQWAEFERDAAIFNSLPNPPTWQAVCDAYNARWDHQPYDEDGDLDRSYMRVDEETGKPYTLSTYNPKSKWDYWRIGGRWPRYFAVCQPKSSWWEGECIQEPLSWEWQPRPWGEESKPDRDARDRLDHSWVEAGPRGMLDFEAMRLKEENQVRQEYADFMRFVKQTGFSLENTKGWSEFVTEFIELENSEEKWAIRDRAREVYRLQPLVAALNASEEYRWAWDCLIDKYRKNDLEELVRQARRDAVPGYATLTLEGNWVAPGEMGWFGCSSDDDESRAEYKEWANGYLEGLPSDTILVVLDLHI